MTEAIHISAEEMKVQNNINKFESLIIQDIRSQGANYKPKIIDLDAKPNLSEPVLAEVSSSIVNGRIDQIKPSGHKRHDSTVFLQKSYLEAAPPSSLVDDAREILRSQPGIEDVQAVLSYLQYGIDGRHDFNIKVNGPKQSLLARALVQHTIPDLWPSLSQPSLSEDETKLHDTLLSSMLSALGIELLVAQIQHISKQPKHAQKMVELYCMFLQHLLTDSGTLLLLVEDTSKLYEKDVQRRLCWQSITTLLAGSKTLSTISQAQQHDSDMWLGSGPEYTRWLARNVVKVMCSMTTSDAAQWRDLGQFMKRALSLGYKDILVTELYQALLLGSVAHWTPLHKLIEALPEHDQRLVFDTILDDLEKKYLSDRLPDSRPNMTVSAVAAMINGLVQHNESLMEYAVEWISSSNASHPSLEIRRAMFAVLAQSQARLEKILEKALTRFGDKSYIQHAPTAQQESLACSVLLSIAYLNRSSSSSLKQHPIPSLVMHTVSNRLSSSVPRIRILGMIVGVAMSRCVDESVMDFGTEEMDTDEVKALLALTDIRDTVGDMDNLKKPPLTHNISKKRKIARAPAKAQIVPTTSKVVEITEVEDEDDEDDLVPYAKPDHDPEDSDEDPTLINRNKPRPPIYIIDLIKQLQSPPDKLDIISSALKNAAKLISRKAEHGTELSDNIHGLGQALINLQDGISGREQQQEKLEALVECIAARPKEMGKYITSTYFNSDFSMSQRSTMLIALGLGARRLVDNTLTTTQQTKTAQFQRQLRDTTLKHNPISSLATIATRASLQPLALSALETAELETTPAAHALRINNTTRRSTQLTKPAQPRTRKIPRETHETLVHQIYTPLISPLTALLAYSNTSTKSATSLLHPATLTLHIHTLTLLLHTIGPIGLSIPALFATVVSETLLLLTHLQRATISLDAAVLPALLGLLFALLEVAEEMGVAAQERLLGNEFGAMTVAAVQWVERLSDMNGVPPVPTPKSTSKSTGRGEMDDGVPWSVLAAGIQVRWMEMGKRFQGRMLGLNVD